MLKSIVCNDKDKNGEYISNVIFALSTQNSVNPDQMPQNVDSDQCLYWQPLIQSIVVADL